MHVDAFRAGGNGTHQREVSTVAAHHLDNEATVEGHGGLLDLVHDFDNAVEGRVGADAQLGARQIVVDAGWNTKQRDVEGREVVPLFVESM